MVFATFLDCSKAFDKVSHHGIFLKLLQRGLPLCFLNLIIYWFLNMSSRCKWENSYSEYFDVTSSTKQGGILSPEIFAVYIDDLVKLLKKMGIGCHIALVFLACILFADDICLIAPTRGALQTMIKVCEEYCKEFCLSFNVKKSKSMLFAK